MGHPIDDAIAAAGAQLAQAWKNPQHQIPSADLHPAPDALAFRIQVMEGQIKELQVTLRDLITALKRSKQL
jgi:hypothetical protein